MRGGVGRRVTGGGIGPGGGVVVGEASVEDAAPGGLVEYGGLREEGEEAVHLASHQLPPSECNTWLSEILGRAEWT